MSCCSSDQYDMPRHAFDPLQCGWISMIPFSFAHIVANWSCVRAPVVTDVICGLAGTPPSHSVSGTGVSMSTEVEAVA